MKRCMLALVALSFGLSTVHATEIRGSYVEARTCDVWTGPCFANADFNLGGKNAVLGWSIDRGSFDGVALDGLSVVVVVSAGNTLGLEQNTPSKAVVIVDEKAGAAQRTALIAFVRKQAGDLAKNVVATRYSKIEMITCPCKENNCVVLDAGIARVKTRCLDLHHDKACGNESAFYPPLVRGVVARPAAAVEHIYRGTNLEGTYSDYERRGAYVGTFVAK